MESNVRTCGDLSKATAPGKIILAGEHSVVYGRPAVAVPVWEATAQATITPIPPGSGCVIAAHDLGRTLSLAEAPDDDPLALIVRKALSHVDCAIEPNWEIGITSTIPIASGLGSGAAVSAAIIRAICSHVDFPIQDADVSQLVYESERLHHGTPSGIDNTVIAYGLPVWYVKGQSPALFKRAKPLTLMIGDSGVVAPTKESVGAVRKGWQKNPHRYEAIFDQISTLVSDARDCIESGELALLGSIFDQNHELLRELDVSHPTLDALVDAARSNGAMGAKLSGGGRGGNMIALVRAGDEPNVEQALLRAGAKSVLVTIV